MSKFEKSDDGSTATIIYSIATDHKCEVKLHEHSNHTCRDNRNILKKRARSAKPTERTRFNNFCVPDAKKKSQGYGRIIMKKYLLILATIIGLGVSANAASILLRGTQKVCGNGAELTLYQTGKMVFWYDGEKKSGKYNIEDGYINLFDENGENIFSFKYSYDNRTHTLLWVDVKGQRLTKGGCE